jgi:hypothetical protein
MRRIFVFDGDKKEMEYIYIYIHIIDRLICFDEFF